MILKEIKINYAKKYPLTAEMVFKKIRLDISSLSIFENLLAKINQNEKNKLLGLITKHQLDYYNSIEEIYQSEYPFDPEEDLNHNLIDLASFFKIVKTKASNEKLTELLEILVKKVENGRRNEIISLFELYIDSLDSLSEQKRDFILLYVIGVLQQYIQSENGLNNLDYRQYKILGKYLSNLEVLKSYYRLLLNLIIHFYNIRKVKNNQFKVQAYIDFHDLLFIELTPAQRIESENIFRQHFVNDPDFVVEFLKIPNQVS